MTWFDDDRIALAVALVLNVVYAAAILLAAFFLAGWVRRRILRFSDLHPRVDKTLFGFLGSVAQYAVLAFALLFVLQRFGIQTTSLVAVIGAAGLAIGLALQGTLSNLAAGIMLVLFRPFRVGDSIEAAGRSGTVRTISLFNTELTTYDGLQLILPNGDIWTSAILNYSANPTRMIDQVFSVSYDSDLRQVDRVLAEVVAAESRALPDPAPFIKLTNLGESSVDFTVRIWTRSGDWWAVKNDLLRTVKDRFDAEGIEIPFPTQTLLTERKPRAEPGARLISPAAGS